jgi:hypothetical protein
MTHSYYPFDITANSNNTTTHHKNDLKMDLKPLDCQVNKSFNSSMDIRYEYKIIVKYQFYLNLRQK